MEGRDAAVRVWQTVLTNIDTGDEYRGRFAAEDAGNAIELALVEAVAQHSGTTARDWATAAVYVYDGEIG